MERIVRHITEKLTAQLPRFREFYTPEDLQVLEIPSFITERVILEMHRNLNESVVPPDTEWADMKGDSVRFAWKNFLEAIKAEVRMPASYAPPLLETAVADSLDLATQPRKSIPEILFGRENTLTIEELKKRIRYVTVGRALAAALIRYMEKKGKTSLSLDDCKKIIRRIDDKLVVSFNSLEWAKELEPLFVLAGPSVDTDLFRLYFDDKDLKKYSRLFEHLNKSLDRSEFIEIMSSPDEVESKDRDKEPVKPRKDRSDKEVTASKNEKNKQAQPGKDSQAKEETEDEFIPDDSILSAFQKRRIDSIFEEDEIKETESADEDENEGDTPLHSRFKLDQDEPGSTDDEIAEEDESTIYKEMNLKKSSRDLPGKPEEKDEPSDKLDRELIDKWNAIAGDAEKSEEDIEDLAETEKPQDDEEDAGVESVELYNETDDEEDVPIWRAFLDREDLDSAIENEKREAGTENESENDEKQKLAEKLTDQFFGNYDEDEPDDQRDTERLRAWISDEKERFVENIFSGSERAFDEAIEDVAAYDEWKYAAKYVKKEIFNRNRIDIFDEVAVDFTDRLHTFFIENKS